MNAIPIDIERHPPSRLSIALALGVLYVIWGSTYLGIRIALQGFPPFLLGAIRMAAAGGLMYAVLRWRGERAPTRGQWKTLAVLSFWMILLSNGFVNFAEQKVSSGLAAVAVASTPLWVGLFSALRGRHPGRGEWVGLGIGMLGVIWLNFGGELRATPLGMIALAVASLAWAWGSIWSRDQDLPSPFMSAAGQMLCGSLWMLATALLTGERMHALPSPAALGALAYLAVFGSIIGFTAYIWLLHHVRPVLASSYAYVNPPIAVLLGAALAGEHFGLHELGAMAVIVAGVAMVIVARGKR
ncbi:MAG: drug/metabolite exporter YedA [Proteobacteria bacterium]|nr:drug/metabolite exporter YedA [Pseudomonadota bacterium]